MRNYMPPQPQPYHCAKCAGLRARLTALQDENKKLRDELYDEWKAWGAACIR